MSNIKIEVKPKVLCRICLLEVCKNSKEIKGKWEKWFLELVGDLVTNGSTILCLNCVEKLKEFTEFKEQARQSNNLWNSKILNPSPDPVKIEPYDKNDDCCVVDDSIDYSDYAVENKLKVEVEPKNLNGHTQCCDKCNKVYTSHKRLKTHLETCGRPQYLDEIKYAKLERKRTSSVEYKDKPEGYDCGLCDFKSVDKSMMNQHVAEHFKNNDLICKLCDFKGSDFADMEAHRFTHQHPEVKSIGCHVCGKRSWVQEKIIFHFRSMHISKNKICTCRYCNKPFTCYRSWKWHEHAHINANYKCDLCGKDFNLKKTLKEHMASHMNRKKHICHICGNCFTRIHYLKVHLSMVHSYDPIKCSHCSRTFKSKAHLEDHLAQLKKAKIYSCPECSKMFADKTSRDKHAFFHTGARPFQCSECSASYKVKSTLKIHMRTHTGERPFVCSICGKGFISSMPLKRHMGIHSGKRSHQCTHCVRSFHQKALLNAHIQKAHAQVQQNNSADTV